MRTLVYAFIIGLMLSSGTAFALPDHILQEGLVYDDQGRPIDGEHIVRIRLYPDTRRATPPVFDEVHPAVEFINGHYAIMVGSVQDLEAAVFERDNLYMSISIDGGAELLPRLPLSRVPAAFRASVADNVIGPITLRSVSIGGRVIIDEEGSERSATMAIANGPAVSSRPRPFLVFFRLAAIPSYFKVRPGQPMLTSAPLRPRQLLCSPMHVGAMIRVLS